MSYKNESMLVKAMARAIREKYPDSWIFKVVGNPYQMAGVPDILVGVEGLLVGIEAKHQKLGETAKHAFNRISAQQDVMLQEMAAAGVTCGVAIDLDGALSLVAFALGQSIPENVMVVNYLRQE